LLKSRISDCSIMSFRMSVAVMVWRLNVFMMWCGCVLFGSGDSENDQSGRNH
jgi:hypothetical protein